ncbi:hypothetical protein Tco_0431798 [Tanacetum coccineum]
MVILMMIKFVHDMPTIRKLDISDPLHLHPNDSAAFIVISVKLKDLIHMRYWEDSGIESTQLFLNGGAVTWKSSKQDTVADSTCESEYIAACEASKEAIWMKNFIGDLGVVPTVQDPIEIFCDNKSAVALTKEPKDHGKSKHIERKYHFVRSKVEEGHVIVKHIRSEDNPADPFTKALAKSRHDEHARSIGLKDNIKF